MAKQIAVFSQVPFRGGVATMSQTLVKTLVSLGHDVTVLYPEKSNAVFPRLKPTMYGDREGIAVSSIFERFILTQGLHLGPGFRRLIQRFDLIFAVCGSPYAAYPFVLEQKPVYIWAAVSLDEDLKGRFERFSLLKRTAYTLSLPLVRIREKCAIRGCNHLFALSAPMARIFAEIANPDPSTVSVLLSPVDHNLYAPVRVCRETMGTIIFTGRFGDPRKDIGTLVRAFALVKHLVPGAELLLVGAEQLPPHVQEFARDSGLMGSIRLEPFIPPSELAAKYRAADVFALPSLQEGLCIAALEAMSCGLPVVSTRCGGPESYICDGQNGFFVPVGDYHAMACKLVLLLTSSELRHTMSKNAREYVLSHCSEQAFVDALQSHMPQLS